MGRWGGRVPNAHEALLWGGAAGVAIATNALRVALMLASLYVAAGAPVVYKDHCVAPDPDAQAPPAWQCASA